MTAGSPRRAADLRAQLREHEPDRPWLWRRDWAAGRVEYTNAARPPITIWLFALAFIAALLGVGAMIRASGETSTHPGVGAFLVAFLMASVLLLAFAVRGTVSFLRYRRSVLELGQAPFMLGDRVHGWVRAPGVLSRATSIRVALTCLDEDDSGPSEVPWREEQTIPRAEVDRAGHTVRIPVSIPLPHDQRPTNDDPDRGAIVEWRLSVTADVPGMVDYQATFEIPVFPPEALPENQRVAAAVPLPPPADAHAFTREAAEARGYRVEPLLEGARIAYPPVQGPAGCLAFMLVLVAVTAAATQASASANLARAMLPWMCGVAGLATMAALVEVLADPRRVEVRHGALVLHRSALGWTRRTRIPIEGIQDVSVQSSATDDGAEWNVDVKAGKRSYRVARALKDGAEAKWLAAEIRRLMAEYGEG